MKTETNTIHFKPRPSVFQRNYRPQTKLLKGNVFTPVCQSFCSQGGEGACPSACWDTSLPGQTPLIKHTPLGRHLLGRHTPLGRHPSGQTPPSRPASRPPDRHPPWTDTPLDRHPLGRHPLGRHHPRQIPPPPQQTATLILKEHFKTSNFSKFTHRNFFRLSSCKSYICQYLSLSLTFNLYEMFIWEVPLTKITCLSGKFL